MSSASARRYIGEVVLRRYLVEELLGEGSFAWVYRARSRDGEQVAVKVLHSNHPTATVRFAREIRVLQALPPNPNVAHYVDHGHTPDGRPALIMEYVDGITLKVGLEKRPTLEPRQAVSFVAELCEAFAGLHQLGVAHRDVKPDNILLVRTGGIKLIDFGLIRDAQGILRLLEGEDPLEMRVFQEELDKGVLAGTPEYMAPEQFADSTVADVTQARTDTWSDVFSLGVILFELLTGHKPFVMREVPKQEYARELIRYLRWRLRLRDRDIPRIPGIDSALQSIVNKALRRDPRDRQRDARILANDLFRYLETGQGVIQEEEGRTVVASVSQVLAMQKAVEAMRRSASTDQRPAAFSLFDDGRGRGDSVGPARPANGEDDGWERRAGASERERGALETTDIRRPGSGGTGPTVGEPEEGGPAWRPPPPGVVSPPPARWEERRSSSSPTDGSIPVSSRSLPPIGLDESEDEQATRVLPGHSASSSPPVPSSSPPLAAAGLHLDEPRRHPRRSFHRAPGESPRIDNGEGAFGGGGGPSSRYPVDELLPPPERGLDEEPGEGRGAHRGGFGDASRVAGTFERARDHDADDEVEVNLAEPPKESEPAILWAPTDAPTLAIDDFFSDWERGGEDVFEGYDQEVSEELNLADLAPKTTRGRR